MPSGMHPGGVSGDGAARPPVARLDGAARSYGMVEALRPVSLEIQPGRCLGVVGHNGSGKSTMLQLLAGRLRPSAGAVEVEGIDLSTAEGQAHARRVVAVGGTIAAFYPDLTASEHLELVALAHGMSDVGDQVAAILDRFGLAERGQALPAQLSTGMRQKLDLAAALVRPSRLLLLDEPDRGLDPAARARVWEDVAAYRASGRTVVVATHQPVGLEDVFDEVVLLEAGAVAAHGSLPEVQTSEAAARLGIGT